MSASSYVSPMPKKLLVAGINPMLTLDAQKIGSTRLPPLDPKAWRDQLTSPTDSRPSTPKSVRPPLPNDVDAELRAACTYIVTHPKPSHEMWERDAPKPALDYAAIKSQEILGPAAPARKPSTRARGPPLRHDTPADALKYSYRPNIATEDLFKQDERDRVRAQASSSAISRADQLMAPVEPPKPGTSHSHARSASRTQTHQQNPSIAVRSDVTDRARISARSDSVGTTGSTPHTDSTDYQWSASTPGTSVVMTPARSSKRTSSQNALSNSDNTSAPRVEPVNAEWMRLELEKHKKAIEEREREREKLLEEAARITADVTPTRMPTHSPTPISRVPPRKPVPSRPGSKQAKDASRPETRQDVRPERNESSQPVSRGRADSARADSSQAAVDQEPRGRVPTRSNSKMARASRAASKAATRAASRAESITNDIITHYLRPGSNQVFQSPVSGERPQRSPSRSRTPFGHVKEYFRPSSRPGTAMGSRKPSVDLNHYRARATSTDSFRSGTSDAAASEHSRKRGWRLLNKARGNAATPDMSRPGSSSGRSTREQTRSPSQKTKPAIDLNRELPPLPGLDQWKTDDVEPEMPKRSQTPGSSSINAVIAPAYHGLRRVLSKRGKDWDAPASHLTSKDNVVAARLGSPTPPRSQKQSVDAKRFNSGQSSVGSPPLPLSPGASSLEMDLYQLSLSRSIEPPVDASSPGRLRSRSNQVGQPELRPDHLVRNVSTPSQISRSSQPSPVPVQTAGNPNLVHYARSVMSGAPVADSIRSTNRKSNTSSIPAFGHSRSNSDKASRKYSIDEYNRSIDPRYQHSVDVQGGSSKDKSKRKWWNPKDRKHQGKNWMDQVMQSGARNGMLMTDDVAGGPVVRY